MTIHSTFLDLHRPGRPLLAPNPWDVGSARILAHLGFEALATTSSGFAATLGRLDGTATRDETLAHAAAIAHATPLPVTVDLEDAYADPAETVTLARAAGAAGGSIEDWDGERFRPLEEAAERVALAADAAGQDFVLTARADNFFHGVPDLADTIARLQAYERAGAHVLYAPGLEDLGDIRAVVDAIDAPVNALLRPRGPTVAELARAGVARITVGGALAFAAIGALVEFAQELRDHGTAGYGRLGATGAQAVRSAFGDR